MGLAHAVRQALVSFQRAILQQLRRQWPRIRIRHDLVVVTVDYEHRHVDRLQIFSEVGFRERLDALVGSLGAAHHALSPPVADESLRHFRARPVESIERAARDIEVKLSTVGGEGRTVTVEYLDWRPARIGSLLDHHRRDSVDQHGICHASRGRSRHIMGDLAATCRMADMDSVFEIKRRNQLGHVGGIGIHLIAAAGLVGSPVTAPVVGDDAITLRQEKHHLVVPVIRAQRPTVVEHDCLGFSRSPILVKDTGAIFAGHIGHRHALPRQVAGRQDRRCCLAIWRKAR